MKKRAPSENYLAMLESMFSKNPEDWDNWVRSQGYTPDPDSPACLAGLPKDQWEDHQKVLPTPAIQLYLDADDVLTNHTIDMMEISMEKTYEVTAPWYIDCERTGTEEAGNLQVTCFRLMKEV